MNILRSARGPFVVAVAVPILLATCEGSTEPAQVATTVNVYPPTLSLAAIGRTQQFRAVVLSQRGDTMRSAAVEWSSSASAVVTVTTSRVVPGAEWTIAL